MTSTHELLEALTNHFIKPDDTWAGAVCLTEVTAPNTNRRADLVHIGLWASRGAGAVDVCELKTSRADFRREIDQPAKAEAWWPYSSRFWIVSPGIEVTPPEELPPGWGLMVPGKARRFRVVVAPAEREPKLTEALLVTLLKCTETTRVNALQRQRSEMQRAESQRIDEIRRQAVNRADPKVKERLDLLDQLEAALGAKLDSFPWREQITPGDAAEALKIVAAGQVAQSSAAERGRRAAQDLDRLAADLTKQAAQLRAALPVQVLRSA